MVKNLLSMWEIWVWSMGWEDLLEKGKATHSTILAWKIPWTEEPGGLQSMGLHGSDTTEQLTTQHITRVLRMWVTLFPLNMLPWDQLVSFLQSSFYWNWYFQASVDLHLVNQIVNSQYPSYVIFSSIWLITTSF